MRYKSWANDRMFRWLSQLSHQELMAERATVFRNILGTVYHTYMMDVAWQARLKGRPHGVSVDNPECKLTLLELSGKHFEIDQWFIEYTDNLKPAALNEVVNFKFINGEAATMSRGEILLHAVNHGSYHRAHIDNIHPISVTAPLTDFSVFLKEGC
ncbi:DinB family protein [Granulosicoccus sp.]|nr:DinB family protein [Granulosicoccus sp.]